MSQFNLNRQWIFEHEEAFTVLYPGHAGSVDRTQDGCPVPGTTTRDVEVARMDVERWDHITKGS